MRVKELKPRSKVDEIELIVANKEEPRDFTSRYGTSGRVCSAKCVDDEGDEIILTLWNEEIDKVENNTRVKITNGWVSEWQGNLQVSAGKFGKLEVIE